jgi:hypothetical protein
MKQAVLGYEKQFFINGTQLSGVQTIEGSYAIQEKPINVIGWGHVNHNFNDLQSTLVPEDFVENKEYIRNEAFMLTEDGFRVMTDDSCLNRRPTATPKSLAVVNSPLEGSFSINSVLVSEDFILDFTGDNPFTGSIHHGKQYFGFYNGYVTKHGISCGIGQIPTTSTSISIYGDIGGNPDFFKIENEEGVIRQDNDFAIAEETSMGERGYNASGKNPFPEIRVPNHGSISLECRGAETNRVTSFNHNINVQRDAIYTVGSSTCAQVDIRWPVTTTTNFTIEVDKYEYGRLRAYLTQPTLEDIAVKINDCHGDKIQHYNIKEARLISESVSAGVDGRLTVNLSYNSYYNKR